MRIKIFFIWVKSNSDSNHTRKRSQFFILVKIFYDSNQINFDSSQAKLWFDHNDRTKTQFSQSNIDSNHANLLFESHLENEFVRKMKCSFESRDNMIGIVYSWISWFMLSTNWFEPYCINLKQIVLIYECKNDLTLNHRIHNDPI